MQLRKGVSWSNFFSGVKTLPTVIVVYVLRMIIFILVQQLSLFVPSVVTWSQSKLRLEICQPFWTRWSNHCESQVVGYQTNHVTPTVPTYYLSSIIKVLDFAWNQSKMCNEKSPQKMHFDWRSTFNSITHFCSLKPWLVPMSPDKLFVAKEMMWRCKSCETPERCSLLTVTGDHGESWHTRPVSQYVSSDVATGWPNTTNDKHKTHTNQDSTIWL